MPACIIITSTQGFTRLTCGSVYLSRLERVVQASCAMSTMLGGPVGMDMAIVGLQLYSFMHPDDVDVIMSHEQMARTRRAAKVKAGGMPECIAMDARFKM